MIGGVRMSERLVVGGRWRRVMLMMMLVVMTSSMLMIGEIEE